MNLPEHLLTIVMEECDEVSQRTSKALRFGIGEVQPGQDLSNRDRMLIEYADLQGAFEMLYETGIIAEPHPAQLRELIDAKKEKIKKFLEYSKEQGTLP